MPPRKKRIPPVAPSPDARTGEEAERVLCAQCGASVQASETVAGEAGDVCLDCATRPEGAAIVVEPPAPPTSAETIDELREKFEHVKAARDVLVNDLEVAQKKHAALFDRYTELAERQAKVEAALSAASTIAAATVTPGELEEAQAQVARLVDTLAEARAAEQAQNEALLNALARGRWLAQLLGLDAEESVAIAPWMIDLATSLANEAPEHLDETALALLIADGIHRAFKERTAANGTIHQARLAHLAGAAFVALEEAGRAVESVIRDVPDDPADEKMETLETAWAALNVAANEARAVTLAERDRLTGLLAAQRFVERPRATDRKIVVVRPAPPGEGTPP